MKKGQKMTGVQKAKASGTRNRNRKKKGNKIKTK